jgi:hypothetical protein
VFHEYRRVLLKSYENQPLTRVISTPFKHARRLFINAAAVIKQKYRLCSLLACIQSMRRACIKSSVLRLASTLPVIALEVNLSAYWAMFNSLSNIATSATLHSPRGRCIIVLFNSSMASLSRSLFCSKSALTSTAFENVFSKTCRNFFSETRSGIHHAVFSNC